MNGLIALIMLIFLVTGWTYGIGAGTLRTLAEVIAAIEKSIKNMGGTIFLFFVLSQFVAYFTYTNIGTVMALSLSGALQAANIGALPLLIGFIVVVAIIDLLLTGAIAKWAIFAPVFVPLLMKLGVEPEAVLAAYRVGDFADERDHPAQRLFRARRRLRPEIRQVRGCRHDRFADAPLCRVDVRAVDGSVCGLEGPRPAVGPVTDDAQSQRIQHSNDRMDIMSNNSIPLDVAAAEDHLMRFLSVEGVTGQEANIAAAVCDALKKVGVPESAIRFDDANKRIPLPTETGNLIVDLPGTRPGPRLAVFHPPRHRAALRRRQAAARGRPHRLGRHHRARRRCPHRRRGSRRASPRRLSSTSCRIRRSRCCSPCARRADCMARGN